MRVLTPAQLQDQQDKIDKALVTEIMKRIQDGLLSGRTSFCILKEKGYYLNNLSCSGYYIELPSTGAVWATVEDALADCGWQLTKVRALGNTLSIQLKAIT